MRLESATYESPIGPLTLLECAEGPLLVEYPGRSGRLRWKIEFRAAVPAIAVEEGGCRRATAWLDGYFAGRPRPFPFPRYLLRWFDLSAAQVLVFRALRRIPFGEAWSYADVARLTRMHPRVVGQLVGSNPLSILIPCHRVVGKNGALVGYGGGIQKKRWLLAHETRHAGVVLR